MGKTPGPRASHWSGPTGPLVRGLCMLVLLYALGPSVPAARATRTAQPPTIAECLKQFHRACLTPAEVRAYYGIDTLARQGITGQGRTIVIVDAFGSPTLKSDLKAFDTAFALPDPSLTILAPLGAPPIRVSGWAVETTLDVEWAHAVAPAARIVLLESPVDETEGTQGLPEFLTLERYALRHHLGDVISQSWGATENTLFTPAGRKVVAQYHQFYIDASAQGVTLVAGSGDQGAAGIDMSLTHYFTRPAVSYPASDPLVLSVGGTTLAVKAQGKVSSETAWPLSGGGASALFAEPDYQRGLPPAAQRRLAAHRGMPDVAYNASQRSGVLIYFRGLWHPIAGTSAGAPQWAGLVALADQLAGRRLGAIQAALYSMACSTRYATDYRDVVRGRSVGPGPNGSRLSGVGYAAGPGWDAVTGLGAPRAAALVPDLAHFISAHAPAPSGPGIGACAP